MTVNVSYIDVNSKPQTTDITGNFAKAEDAVAYVAKSIIGKDFKVTPIVTASVVEPITPVAE